MSLGSKNKAMARRALLGGKTPFDDVSASTSSPWDKKATLPAFAQSKRPMPKAGPSAKAGHMTTMKEDSSSETALKNNAGAWSNTSAQSDQDKARNTAPVELSDLYDDAGHKVLSVEEKDALFDDWDDALQLSPWMTVGMEGGGEPAPQMRPANSLRTSSHEADFHEAGSHETGETSPASNAVFENAAPRVTSSCVTTSSDTEKHETQAASTQSMKVNFKSKSLAERKASSSQNRDDTHSTVWGNSSQTNSNSSHE
ncbi:hypothetical protein V5T82_15195 [Magnetovibrio sp. PR-2]|uniref:hypothetical protein n=1 Tax=Magnetovibrio sp. PR-2 TaxID=3120356 RepID=UPI002FCE666A